MLLQIEHREQFENMNCEEELVRIDDDSNLDNCDEIFEDCNSCDITQDNP